MKTNWTIPEDHPVKLILDAFDNLFPIDDCPNYWRETHVILDDYNLYENFITRALECLEHPADCPPDEISEHPHNPEDVAIVIAFLRFLRAIPEDFRCEWLG